MLAADHRDEFSTGRKFFRSIVKRVHHSLRRINRWRLVEGVNAQLVDFGISLFVVKLHVARRIDDRGGAFASSTAVRNGSFIRNGPNQNASLVVTRELFLGDAAEIHRSEDHTSELQSH